MKAALLVAIGGGLGSLARYGVNLAFLRLFGSGFPYGVLVINVTGSFLMGFAVELIARRFGASPDLRLLITTGFLGGYTTFSAFSLDAVSLAERGATLPAVAYVMASVVLSIGALVAGLVLARQIA